MSDTVRFAKLPTQGVVFGIDKAGFVALTVVAGITAFAVVGRGVIGLFATAPITVPIAILAFGKVHSETLFTHILREVMGLLRKATKGNVHKTRPEKKKPTPETALDLPGWPGRLHLYAAQNGAVVVWDSYRQLATISCLVATPGMGMPQPDAPSTVTDEERAALIWEWAKVLGSFTQKPHVQRVSVIEHTRPGTDAAERRYYAEQVAGQRTAAGTSYLEALDLADASVVMHVTQLSVTFKMSAEAKQLAKSAGSSMAGLLQFAELEMETISDALLHAGFTRMTWMNPREWGAWGKAIIDPAAQSAVDSRLGAEWEGVDPHAAMPMLVDDQRTFVETDSAWHRAYWIHEWPRYDTYPGFLSRLVFATQQGDVPIRHTFALVASPVPVGKAMKTLETEKRTWTANANLRAKSGKHETAADIADWRAIEQHEADLVAGQGELRFSAYLVVTATSREALEHASASMLNACSATGLEPRVLPWQQWEAVATVAFPAGMGMK